MTVPTMYYRPYGSLWCSPRFTTTGLIEQLFGKLTPPWSTNGEIRAAQHEVYCAMFSIINGFLVEAEAIVYRDDQLMPAGDITHYIRNAEYRRFNRVRVQLNELAVADRYNGNLNNCSRVWCGKPDASGFKDVIEDIMQLLHKLIDHLTDITTPCNYEENNSIFDDVINLNQL